MRLKEPKKKLRDKGTIAMGLLALTTNNLVVKRLQVMAVITSQVRVAQRSQLRSAMPPLSRYQMKNRKCLHCVCMMLDSKYLLITHLESWWKPRAKTPKSRAMCSNKRKSYKKLSKQSKATKDLSEPCPSFSCFSQWSSPGLSMRTTSSFLTKGNGKWAEQGKKSPRWSILKRSQQRK